MEQLKSKKICKVFTVKWGGHVWYVQQMPGIGQFGRDYAIMKDRRKLYYRRFRYEEEAVQCLLNELNKELDQQTLLYEESFLN